MLGRRDKTTLRLNIQISMCTCRQFCHIVMIINYESACGNCKFYGKKPVKQYTSKRHIYRERDVVNQLS